MKRRSSSSCATMLRVVPAAHDCVAARTELLGAPSTIAKPAMRATSAERRLRRESAEIRRARIGRLERRLRRASDPKSPPGAAADEEMTNLAPPTRWTKALAGDD